MIAQGMCQPPRHRGICPYCHCTQEEAIHTGLVGCPLCYEMLDTAALNHFGIQKGDAAFALMIGNGMAQAAFNPAG